MRNITLNAERYLPGFVLVEVFEGKKELAAMVMPFAIWNDEEVLKATINEAVPYKTGRRIDGDS